MPGVFKKLITRHSEDGLSRLVCTGIYITGPSKGPGAAQSGIGSTSVPLTKRDSEQEIPGQSRFSAKLGSILYPGTRQGAHGRSPATDTLASPRRMRWSFIVFRSLVILPPSSTPCGFTLSRSPPMLETSVLRKYLPFSRRNTRPDLLFSLPLSLMSPHSPFHPYTPAMTLTRQCHHATAPLPTLLHPL